MKVKQTSFEVKAVVDFKALDPGESMIAAFLHGVNGDSIFYALTDEQLFEIIATCGAKKLAAALAARDAEAA